MWALWWKNLSRCSGSLTSFNQWDAGDAVRSGNVWEDVGRCGDVKDQRSLKSLASHYEKDPAALLGRHLSCKIHQEYRDSSKSCLVVLMQEKRYSSAACWACCLLFHEPLQSAYPPTVYSCHKFWYISFHFIVLSFHLLLRLLHVGIRSQHFWDVAMQRPSCARPMNFQWFLICEVDFEFVTYFVQVFWLKFLEIFRYLSTNYIETPRKTMYFASLVGLSQVVFQLPRGVCLHDGREECPSLILMKNAYFSHFYCLLEKMRTYCLLSSLNFHHGKVWKSLRHCRIVVHKNGCLEVEAIWSAFFFWSQMSEVGYASSPSTLAAATKPTGLMHPRCDQTLVGHKASYRHHIASYSRWSLCSSFLPDSRW